MLSTMLSICECTQACAMLPALMCMVALYLYRLVIHIEDTSLDDTLKNLLEGKPPPVVCHGDVCEKPKPCITALDKSCRPVVEKLNAAPLTESEAETADQMQEIVKSKALPYSALIEDPGRLLRCSKHMRDSRHGALWTRFTVQFNLYAGSIVALGSDEQRQELLATQETGSLGCFAFTERGAGVLSGAALETTATFLPESDAFRIESGEGSGGKV